VVQFRGASLPDPRGGSVVQFRGGNNDYGTGSGVFGIPHHASFNEVICVELQQRLRHVRAQKIERLVDLAQPVEQLDLKAEFGLTYIFISHDLNVVRFISDRVMVMYLGRVAEIGPSDSVLAAPAHPYTQALLASMPSLDPDNRTQKALLAGDPPNPIDPPGGCRFHPRCALAEGVCGQVEPPLEPVRAGNRVACLARQPGSGHSAAPAEVRAAGGRPT